MRAAAEAFPDFEARVMRPLVEGGAHFKANLKTLERAREKVRMEYDGDAALVKDLCRGLVVADSVPELEAACAALKDLAAKGVLEIAQVKNRLRDPPEAVPKSNFSANGWWRDPYTAE